MATENTVDQTRFTFEHPQLEPVYQPVAPEVPGTTPPSTKSKKWLFIIGAVVSVLILILLALVVMRPQQMTNRVIPEETEEEAQLFVNKNELDIKLDELKKELDAADPTKPPLTFPFVEMDLRLEPKAR
jgi:hypothetical protein